MREPQTRVDQALAAALDRFASVRLRAGEIALTLVNLTAPGQAVGQHRGDVPLYPASVVKLFYLAAAHRWLQDRQLADTPELRRALRAMIVDSSNEATGYVVDVLTGTTSGPELPPRDLAAWQDRRNAVNRYFHSLGYPEINVNRKTWTDGPYGRDRQARDDFHPGRNALTTNATARLLVKIATGQCVSPEGSRQMLELLKRDFVHPAPRDDQARQFIGRALPPAARLWSKAGDTSEVRHDAAIVELPDNQKWVLVIFTTRPDDHRIIPEFARLLLSPAS